MWPFAIKMPWRPLAGSAGPAAEAVLLVASRKQSAYENSIIYPFMSDKPMLVSIYRGQKAMDDSQGDDISSNSGVERRPLPSLRAVYM